MSLKPIAWCLQAFLKSIIENINIGLFIIFNLFIVYEIIALLRLRRKGGGIRKTFSAVMNWRTLMDGLPSRYVYSRLPWTCRASRNLAIMVLKGCLLLKVDGRFSFILCQSFPIDRLILVQWSTRVTQVLTFSVSASVPVVDLPYLLWRYHTQVDDLSVVHLPR